MIQFNDNPILIDTYSTRKISRKQKINCVICFPKVELTCINPEEMRYKCMRCKNTYQLGGYEILPQEDELESSHEEGEGGEDSVGGLLSANEDEFNKEEDSDHGCIPVPKYFRDSATTKVIDYREI